MIAALALALSSLSPIFEFEIGGGLAHSLETGNYPTNTYPFARPALQARAALDFVPGVALGGTFLAVVGGEARNSTACCGSDSGNQAFSATATLVTLRVHSSGEVQFWAEGGAGTGHLISLQTESSFENPPLRGRAGLALRLGAGVREAVAGRFLLGAELAWTRWSNVEQGPGAGSPGYNPARYGLSTSALLLQVSAGFAVGR